MSITFGGKRRFASAGASHVISNSLIVARKVRKLIVPHPSVEQTTMQKDHGVALTRAIIRQPHPRKINEPMIRRDSI
jgi:hypothetical protein